MRSRARVLSIFVLFNHPRDFPHHFVVREQRLETGPPGKQDTVIDSAPIACLYESVEEAARDYEQHYWMPRHRDDEPAILGVWL